MSGSKNFERECENFLDPFMDCSIPSFTEENIYDNAQQCKRPIDKYYFTLSLKERERIQKKAIAALKKNPKKPCLKNNLRVVLKTKGCGKR